MPVDQFESQPPCRQLGMALAAAVLVSSLGGFIGAPPAAAQPASARMPDRGASVELTDAAGDVKPLVYLRSTGSGPATEVKYPGFDVIKLVVASDGRALRFSATLTAPPTEAAYEVLEFHIDADNDLTTGVRFEDGAQKLHGMEYYGALEACLETDSFGTSCTGAEAKPTGHAAVVTLGKYGRDWMVKDALFDLPASGTVKEPAKTPIHGAVVQSTVDYAAMGLKSGQTIRLIVREFSAGKVAEVGQGYFPEILLTLK